MSIEFRIKQNGEKHCYSNWTMNLKSFLTALYSNENPYEALMSLDRNNQLSDDNYTRDKRNGLITYDIDFDRDTITRHEKGRQFKMNEMSKIPLGAAYSLILTTGFSDILTAVFRIITAPPKCRIMSEKSQHLTAVYSTAFFRSLRKAQRKPDCGRLLTGRNG